jgi:hypothetical protein
MLLKPHYDHRPGEYRSAREGHPVAAGKPGHRVVRIKRERPDSVAVVGAQDRRPAAVRHLHAQVRAPGAMRQDVTDVEVLSSRKDLAGAAHPQQGAHGNPRSGLTDAREDEELVRPEKKSLTCDQAE